MARTRQPTRSSRLLTVVLCAFGVGCAFVAAPPPRTTRTSLRQGPVSENAGDLGNKLMTWGKHKGKTFREVAEMRPYVDWCKQKIADAYYAREFFRYIAAKEAGSTRTRSQTKTSSNTVPKPRRAVTARKAPALQRQAAASPSPSRDAAGASRAPARTYQSRARPGGADQSKAAPGPRRSAPKASPAPRAGSGRRAAPVAPLKVNGPNVDMFELPRGLLHGRSLWSCMGKVEPTAEKYLPWSYSFRDGWTYVGRVRQGRKLAVNLEDSDGPPGTAADCLSIDESDLTELEYARFVGALLEEAGRNDMAAPREVFHKGKRVEALPKYRFRGVLFDGKAHIAPALEQELYAPEDKTLAGQKRTAMASMVGLKVRPLGPAQPWFTGLVVCEPENKNNVTLTPSIKQNLVQMTRTPSIKDATAKALVDELLLTVSKNCTNARDLKMTFVANALRPSLSGRDQEEKLRRLEGWKDFNSLPPTIMILDASLRQSMIANEVSRLSDKLFKASFRPRRVDDPKNFRKLQPPQLVFGKKMSVPGKEKPSKALFTLDRAGAFQVQKQEQPLRVAAATFGANTRQQAFAAKVLEDVKQLLKKFGLNVVVDSPEPVHSKGSVGKDVELALKSDTLTHADAVLLLGANMNDEGYNQAKYQALSTLNDAGRHVATQWFDLGKSNVWSAGSKTLLWAEKICAVGLMAKLGHAPWAVDVRPWFHMVPKDIKVGVIGYDVCHLRDPTNKRKHASIAASIRVESHSDAEPWLLSRISFRTERVKVETVPPASLKEMIPADFARGRVLIIHRDGEFPHPELDTLRKYHQELVASEGGSGTTFVLVECVKWAGGSPRLYEGTKSPEAGTMVALSDKEVLLASSKDIFQGTANPLNLRLAGVLGDLAASKFALEEFAWAQTAFDLSYLHHGSVLRRPRLPVTTHFADRLAYMLAALGKEGGDWERELKGVSEGTEQFWL